MSNHNTKPRFSIVIAVHDQAQEIEQNLPSLLTQQYDEGFEVIVVDESSTDDTLDVLKRLKNEHSKLYTTFLPKYHFQNNRQRLALTIGVKAAKYEWVIFTEITTPPPSGQWLAELAEYACQPTVLLLGYINAKSGDVRLQPFDDVADARKIISKTERKKAQGHTGGRWLRYQRGWYDFVVVATSQAHETLRLFAVKGQNRLG